MARPTPRLHRLPQRLDYTLIPAPLDLSLPLVTEKSHLPAIIVTPSSPCSPRDFSIAFLAPAEKPSIKQRISNYTAPKLRARSTIIILFLLVVLMCHFITYRLATRRPHLQFNIQSEAPATSTQLPLLDWFDLGTLLDTMANEKRELVIAEGM